MEPAIAGCETRILIWDHKEIKMLILVDIF
jgi:hypothetical protein